jgi:osmotically-inducible protein OsmY
MRCSIDIVAVIAMSWPMIASAAEPDNYYSDPAPLQATHGISDCAAPAVRVLSPEDARREAHQRVERGTSCWLAGTCEPGGDYKNDAVVNARVADAIANDARFANTSIWVETLRKFVTLKGCVADDTQSRELESLVRSVTGVKLVWQEAKVKSPPPPKR